MAKARSKSRKPGGSTRAKSTKKAAGKKKSSAKRARGSAPTPRSREVLDLKTLRHQIDRAVGSIARRLTMTAQPAAALTGAQAMLSRWASEIDEICEDPIDGPCGPTMLIEL